jgi:hypothetical protein
LGQFLFVTDPGQVDPAEHWLSVFTTAFPRASHRAVGLVRAPSPHVGRRAWQSSGLEIEYEDALSTSTLPALTPLPSGYRARPLRTDLEWKQDPDLDLDEVPSHLRDDRRTDDFGKPEGAPGVS